LRRGHAPRCSRPGSPRHRRHHRHPSPHPPRGSQSRRLRRSQTGLSQPESRLSRRARRGRRRSSTPAPSRQPCVRCAPAARSPTPREPVSRPLLTPLSGYRPMLPDLPHLSERRVLTLVYEFCLATLLGPALVLVLELPEAPPIPRDRRGCNLSGQQLEMVVPTRAEARQLDVAFERMAQGQTGALSVGFELEADNRVGLALVPGVCDHLGLPQLGDPAVLFPVFELEHERAADTRV